MCIFSLYFSTPLGLGLACPGEARLWGTLMLLSMNSSLCHCGLVRPQEPWTWIQASLTYSPLSWENVCIAMALLIRSKVLVSRKKVAFLIERKEQQSVSYLLTVTTKYLM
jgi:hypothetical protein